MPFGAGCNERMRSALGLPCVTAIAVPPAATKGCCAISWAIVFKRWTGSPTSTQGPGYVGPRWNWTSRSGWYVKSTLGEMQIKIGGFQVPGLPMLEAAHIPHVFDQSRLDADFYGVVVLAEDARALQPSSSTAMASAVWMQRMKGDAKMANGRWIGSLP